MTPYKRLPADSPGFRDAPYYVTLRIAGQRVQRCLETNNAAEALTRARALRKTLADAAARSRFDEIKGGTRMRRESTSTLGQLVAAYLKRTRVKPRTAGANVSSLRTILRKVCGADLSDAELDAMPASALNRALLRQYQEAMVRGLDGEERVRAMTTANSTVRQARSLTTRELVEDGIYAEERIRLPDLAGWRAQRLFPEPKHLFTPIPTQLIDGLWAAAPALRQEDPEAYKGFLLSICCGLRRGEAASLRWSQVLEVDGRRLIRLGITKNGQPRLIPLEETVWAELQACSKVVPVNIPSDPAPPSAPADFILAGTATDRWRHTFDRLSRWLEGQGWNRIKKAHELRKHFGAHLAETLGTRTAAMVLGNTEPVLRAHYDALLNVPEVSTFRPAAESK